MTPEEYNRELAIQRAKLWRDTFTANLKPGKNRAEATASVHADNAAREFSKRFVSDLNVTRPAYPTTAQAS